jgi:hypothetical protein
MLPSKVVIATLTAENTEDINVGLKTTSYAKPEGEESLFRAGT